MANFTPGPLNFHKSYNPRDGELTICDGFDALTISIAKGDMLLGEATALFPKTEASLGFPRVNSREEAVANAQLWIAAPEMYAELHENLRQLERALDCIAVVLCDPNFKSLEESLQERIDKTLAVLKKACGE